MKVIFDVKYQSPIAYLDVYEEGDEWVKIQGCADCPLENRLRCCGNHDYENHISCAMQNLITGECTHHVKPNQSKPWYCMRGPFPNAAMNFCALEFKCVKGTNMGKIRRVRDPGNVFVEP